MLGMFFMALAIIMFFIVYQRRLLDQQLQNQKLATEHQSKLLKASMDSQEKERNRVSKDLHDDIGAMLTTIKLYTDQIDMENTPAQLTQLKEKTNQLVDDTIHNVRRISHDLHPAILENLGILEAIENLIDSINGAKNILVDFHHNAVAGMNYQTELMLFRVIQELVNNTLKHAHASHIQLRLIQTHQNLHMTYMDDGVGYLPKDTLNFSGLGIKNIESRVNLLGGEITYRQQDNHTIVSIQISLV
ncbi:hypothetical protein BGP76_18220 [Reichenbachiella sp. MSK19-1]|nr:hypothetical protein BGP76_18220 [Reichenbachiella sp. MSK19-1]